MGESAEPRHIGIILDGNRRWAKKRLLKPWDGHDAGFDKLKKLFQWAKELGIRELSLYCFSMKNFQRDKKEVDFLMKIFIRAANDVLTDKDVHEDKVKVRFVGRLHLLPGNVQEAFRKAMEATKDYSNYLVNLCVAYGGKEEILDGVNRAIADAKEGKADSVDEEGFSKYLYIQSSPDLIIRTSGEQRTSDFLTWHAGYSEWFFLDKHWPDFEKEDLANAVKEFREKRHRRFGK